MAAADEGTEGSASLSRRASGVLGGDAQVMALAGGMKAAAKAERGVGGGPRCGERGAAAAEAEVGLAECEDL